MVSIDSLDTRVQHVSVGYVSPFQDSMGVDMHKVQIMHVDSAIYVANHHAVFSDVVVAMVKDRNKRPRIVSKASYSDMG